MKPWIGAGLGVLIVLAACTGDDPPVGGTSGGSVTDAGPTTTTEAGGGAESGPPNTCEAGKTRCGESCVDLASDPANCGSCGAPRCEGACYGGTCDGNQVTDFSLGSRSGCALLRGGEVWCWGLNHLGQVGAAAAGDRTCTSDIGSFGCRFRATRVEGITKATAISVGGAHACAIVAAGSVVCWGSNDQRQLGHDPATDDMCGTTRCKHTPEPVPDLTGMTGVQAGQIHTCAWNASRAVCWGSNDRGALGASVPGGSLYPPQVVANMASFSKLDAPDDYSTIVCALDGEKRPFCWGNASYGGLGHDATDPSCSGPDGGGLTSRICLPLPAAVRAPVRDLAASDASACVALDTGRVSCWGVDAYGVSPGPSGKDAKVQPLVTDAVQLDASQTHICARSNSKLWCWGLNHRAQLGLGTQLGDGQGGCVSGAEPCHKSPQEVAGIVSTLVRVGQGATMSLGPDGRLVGWGYSQDGRLGHNPETDTLCTGGYRCARSPVPVEGLP